MIFAFQCFQSTFRMNYQNYRNIQFHSRWIDRANSNELDYHVQSTNYNWLVHLHCSYDGFFENNLMIYL